MKLFKRKLEKNKIYFILEKNSQEKCLKLHSVKRKIESILLDNYNYYINKYFNNLVGTQNYNKKLNLSPIPNPKFKNIYI